MERYLKTTIIEEKWHQKRKQEAEERRLHKKRRECLTVRLTVRVREASLATKQRTWNSSELTSTKPS